MAGDDLQSPQIYTDAVGFSTLSRAVSQESIHDEYSSTDMALNLWEFQDFAILYGGSRKRRSTKLFGR